VFPEVWLKIVDGVFPSIPWVSAFVAKPCLRSWKLTFGNPAYSKTRWSLCSALSGLMARRQQALVHSKVPGRGNDLVGVLLLADAALAVGSALGHMRRSLHFW